jgi:hypothetical protein
MPARGYSSIRDQSARLNLSKGGSTSLYVDQNGPASSDNNDGFDWDRPKLTLGAAFLDAEPWTEIFCRSGFYAENIVVPYEHITLHGVVQAGVDRVEICPLSGVPLTVQVGYYEMEGVALSSINADVSRLTGPGHQLHDCFFELDSDGSSQCTAVRLDDCDKIEFYDNNLDGLSSPDSIGVRVDGSLNATVDALIRDNYFKDFGDVGVAGHAINLDNAQRALLIRNIFDSGYNGIYCEVLANALHTIMGNQFYANDNYDICDVNPDPLVSGIMIRNNFYGYAGWFDDSNHDGLADLPIQCYNNYDYAPLSSPHFIGPSFVPRYVA